MSSLFSGIGRSASTRHSTSGLAWISNGEQVRIFPTVMRMGMSTRWGRRWWCLCPPLWRMPPESALPVLLGAPLSLDPCEIPTLMGQQQQVWKEQVQGDAHRSQTNLQVTRSVSFEMKEAVRKQDASHAGSPQPYQVPSVYYMNSSGWVIKK